MNNTAIFSSFKRLQNFPLDITSRFAKIEQFKNYLANDKTAYPGQVVTIYDDPDHNGLYTVSIENDKFVEVKLLNKHEFDVLYTAFNQFKNEITDLDIKNNLESLNKKLNTINDSLQTNNADINARLEAQDTKIANVSKRINDVATVINKNYYTKTQTDNKITKAVNDAIKSIKDFPDVEDLSKVIDTFKEIQDWVSAHEKDYAAVASGLSTLNTKVTKLEKDFNDAIGSNVSNISGQITEITNKVNQITETVTQNETDISKLKETTSGLTNSLKELDNLHRSEIASINSAVATNTGDIEKIKLDIAEINENISDKLKGDFYTKDETDEIFVKKDELNELVNIKNDLKSIEKTLSLSFVNGIYSRQEMVLSKGVLIKEVEIHISNVATSIIPSENYIVALQINNDSNTVNFEKELITLNDIDTEVITDITEIPVSFFYKLNYKVESDSGVKVVFNSSHFKDIKGDLFIRYLE